MCLYPKLIENRKYLPNIKNGGKPPECTDERVKWVAIGCGKCMECRNKAKREWQVRLQEEIARDKSGQFITLSFSDEELVKLEEEVQKQIEGIEGYDLDNAVATLAMRRFLERWRKKYKKSVKHWTVTELGQKSTERIHIHGILWTNNKQAIRDIWQYGNVYIGDYVNGATGNYIVKYIHKQDLIHPNYKPKVLTSPGIGKGYIKSEWRKQNDFKGDKTREYYTTSQGHKIALPKYYRNKIYTEEQREQLWINLIDKGERWVNGIKINVKDDYTELMNVQEQARRLNKQLGYGDDKKNWNRIQYEKAIRNLKKENRHKKVKRDEPPVTAELGTIKDIVIRHTAQTNIKTKK